MSPCRHTLVLVLALLGAGGVWVAGGCQPKNPPRAAQGDLPAEFVAWTPPTNVFVPDRLRISPLTRITRDESGAPIIALHFELRDSFGHVIKCLGIAQVDLFRGDPESDPSLGLQQPLQSWQVDLRDPAENAAAFDDVVTHAYVLHLASLPPQIARLADAPVPSGDDAPPPHALRVRFLFKTTEGNSMQVDAMASLLSR